MPDFVGATLCGRPEPVLTVGNWGKWQIDITGRCRDFRKSP